MEIREVFETMARERGTKDQEDKILALLRWFGPMTRQRIAEVTGICPGSVGGRCYEMLRWGRIEVIGKELILPTRHRQILAATRDLADQAEVA